MRIGITISRTWRDWDIVVEALHKATHASGNPSGHTISYHKVTVIHGASQTDWAVAGIAYMLGMDLEEHPADWKSHSLAAGPIRNAEMVRSGADLWLAFIKGGSRGASGCAELAENAGIPVWRYGA